jgi:hypothetical protein
MNISDIVNWTNENPGATALIIFLAGLAISFLIWFIRKIIRTKIKKPSLLIDVIEEPTMCSSFDAGGNYHRTAYLVYLKITNNSNTSVQIGDIHVGYKSEENDDPENWFWLKKETVLLEDFCVPIGGDKKKIFPFLKQKKSLMNNEIHTFLKPDEDTNGLVYFEQDKSAGEKYPYLEPDMIVQTIIVVHDNKGNKWSKEHRVTKVRIEPIRELCPLFGMTRQLAENNSKIKV